MNYTSLEQRMARSYIDLLPKFIPDENAPVTISEQEEFYLIMKNLYQLSFDEPLLFVSTLNEDDVFPNRLKKSYNKPQLASKMKEFIKSMDSLLQNMYLIGQNSVPKIDKRQQVILSRLGIKDFTKIPSAWTWLASRSETNII